jgi:hypothetical protein
MAIPLTNRITTAAATTGLIKLLFGKLKFGTPATVVTNVKYKPIFLNSVQTKLNTLIVKSARHNLEVPEEKWLRPFFYSQILAIEPPLSFNNLVVVLKAFFHNNTK